jgi:hypothetical protein
MGKKKSNENTFIELKMDIGNTFTIIEITRVLENL